MSVPRSEIKPGFQFIEEAAYEFCRHASEPVIKGSDRLMRTSGNLQITDEDSVKIADALYIGYFLHRNAPVEKKRIRASGEEYMVHPIGVAQILAEEGVDDPKILQAALLHDVLEDTIKVDEPDLVAQIQQRENLIRVFFGEEVLKHVQTDTKVMGGSEADTLEKIIFALDKSQDPPGVLLKLADRLHNMRTITALKPEKQRKNAEETLRVHAPLARLVSMRAWSDELFARSAKVLWPRQTDEALKLRAAFTADDRAKKRMQALGDIFTHNDLFAGIRLESDELPLSSILRVSGKTARVKEPSRLPVRIICESEAQFKHVLDWFNSYKESPVDLFRAGRTEFAFRLDDAEFNVALYSPDGYLHKQTCLADLCRTSVLAADVSGQRRLYIDEKLERPRLFLTQATQKGRLSEYISRLIAEGMQSPFLKVRTLKGDEIAMPGGATALDFAYEIHTDIGNRAKTAKINGKVRPLGTPLHDGDTVEIMHNKNRWTVEVGALDRVAADFTRRHIREALRMVRRLYENINSDVRQQFEKEFTKFGFDLDKLIERLASVPRNGRTDALVGEMQDLYNRIIPYISSKFSSEDRRFGMTANEFVRYARRVRSDAMERGRRLLLDMYQEIYGNLPISDLGEAWKDTDKLLAKYHDFDNFIYECGLSAVDEKVMLGYVGKIQGVEKENFFFATGPVNDRPGLLNMLTATMARHGVKIVTIQNIRNSPDTPPGKVKIEMHMQPSIYLIIDEKRAAIRRELTEGLSPFNPPEEALVIRRGRRVLTEDGDSNGK